MGGFTILVRDREGEGGRFVFEGRSVRVGRSADNDLVLPRRRVSDRHAVIFRKGRRFIVVDLVSTQGTWVGGRRISQPTVVGEGDPVEIGDFSLSCHAGDGGEGEARGLSSDLVPTQERLGALRDALYGERTEGAWARVCALFDEWPEDDDLALGLDYADRLLVGWPDDLRRAPELWKKPLLTGRPNPRFSIVRRLDLNYHFLGAAGAAALARMAWMAQLSALSLRTAYLGDEGVEALTATSCLRGLRALDLSHNEIGDRGAGSIAACAHLEGLERLTLDANPLRGPGVLTLVGSSHLRGLRHLDLSNTSGRELATALAASTQLASLETLRLTDNAIGADGAHILALAACMKTLTALHLSRNRIGDEGVMALTSAPQPTRLTHLDLSHNEIGDAGAQALARSPQLPLLTHLDLTQNRLSPRGIQAIANSPFLPRLDTLRV